MMLLKKPAKCIAFILKKIILMKNFIYTNINDKGIINKILEIIGMESINLGEERLKITVYIQGKTDIYE